MKTIKFNKLSAWIMPVVALFVFASLQTRAQTDKRYEVESGEVVFKTKGPEGEGTKILKFDQYGMREALHETIEKNGRVVKDQLTIFDHGKSYSIDLLTKTGTDGSDITGMSMGMMRPSDGNYAAKGKEMLEQLGGRKVGSQNFLGKNCEKWELNMMGKTTLLLWKGITLRSESKVMGFQILEEAQNIKTGVSFSDDVFTPPADVTISKPDMGEMGFPGMGDEDDGMGMSQEDIEMMQKIQNMSFEEFKKIMKEHGEEELTEEEMKQAYEMFKNMAKMYNNK